MLGRNQSNCSKDNIDNNVTTEIIINVTNEPSEYMFNGRLSDRQCTSRRSVDREQFPFYRFCYTPRCGDTPVLFLLLFLNTNVTLYASSWYYTVTDDHDDDATDDDTMEWGAWNSFRFPMSTIFIRQSGKSENAPFFLWCFGHALLLNDTANSWHGMWLCMYVARYHHRRFYGYWNDTI